MGEHSRALRRAARRYDYERYVCSLFAPADAREDIWALLWLGYELMRIPSLVHEPIAGMVRLKWWQERVGEAARGAQESSVGQEFAPLLSRLRAMQRRERLTLPELEALCEALAGSMEPEGSAPAQVTQAMAAFYRMLATSAGEAAASDAYAALGVQAGAVAWARSKSSAHPDAVMLTAPDAAASRFFHALHRCVGLWQRRIERAQRQRMPLLLHRPLPFLALRLI